MSAVLAVEKDRFFDDGCGAVHMRQLLRVY
jgi:hypothetical protein